MRNTLLASIFVLSCLHLSVSAQSTTTDWPWWRGPSHNGIAAPDQSPPLTWTENENIRWRSAIPGRGHGSPTVLGNKVFVATADNQRKLQVVICYDRKTGDQIWEAIVHKDGLDTEKAKKANQKASFASSTAATDGEKLFTNFFNSDAVTTTALDLNGEIVWQRKITDYVVHQGYGSSPAIYKDLVIVTADNKGGGAVAGLNRESGEIVWRRDRPAKPNYASPVVINVDGKDQLILIGCDLVTSLNPLTGETYWEIEGATTECVTTTVTDGTHIFSSGGYPKDHIAAVKADGSGKVVWENTTRAYVPSLLLRNGFLFVVMDEGMAACFRCDTGEEVWKGRLGGTFSSSPILVGDLIFATNEEGETHIFKANSKKFEKVGLNKLGESVFATPAYCGSQIFMRVAHDQDGTRQEYLYCIGK